MALAPARVARIRRHNQLYVFNMSGLILVSFIIPILRGMARSGVASAAKAGIGENVTAAYGNVNHNKQRT